MRALFQAIMAKFQGSALDTAISSNMYLMEAPEDVALPYAVYMLQSDISDYTFDDTHNEIELIFIINSDEGKAEEVCDNLELLEALYDDCKLSVTGYRFIGMERIEVQLLHDPGEEWQYMIRYKIQLEKV